MGRFFGVLFAALCYVAPALGEKSVTAFYSGNALLELCSKPPGTRQYEVCLAYLVAISDALSHTGSTIGGYRSCRPHGVTSDQIRDVVTKWLRDNPNYRHLAAAGLVANALEDGFPCR